MRRTVDLHAIEQTKVKTREMYRIRLEGEAPQARVVDGPLRHRVKHSDGQSGRPEVP